MKYHAKLIKVEGDEKFAKLLDQEGTLRDHRFWTQKGKFTIDLKHLIKVGKHIRVHTKQGDILHFEALPQKRTPQIRPWGFRGGRPRKEPKGRYK